MRIVVVGATGNVGTSLLEALERDDAVTSVLGLARRRPQTARAKTEFAVADVTRDDLVGHFRGADCVVHLAWLIQPSRDEATLWRTNVEGSSRVFAAVAEAGVPALVVASSVGAYSPGPKRRVDESWRARGVATSWYGRQKGEVERRLDVFEAEHPAIRVARLRPALIMKREAAEEVRRLFFGPLLPSALVRPGRLPLVPHIPGLVVQVLHSRDAGQAYRLAATRDVRGAFNVATEPELDGRRLAAAIGARALPVPRRVARVLASLTWRLRLQPTSPDWVDLGLRTPLLDTRRARDELGWKPAADAVGTVRELLLGLSEQAGGSTPPLRPGGRGEEIGAGVGEKPV
jgi:UDP-glucose 4-epimerase